MGQNNIRTLSSFKYDSIETFLSKIHEFKQQNADIIHRIGPGMYIREMSMKKGTFAIGEDHQIPSQNIMLKGKVRMLNPDRSVTDITAPAQFTGVGGRKVGYFLEDTVWLNIFATNETDIEKIEATITGNNGALLLSAKNRLLLEAPNGIEERFRKNNFFEKEVGIGVYFFRKASIGSFQGLFATATIKEGMEIGVFKSDKFTFIAGSIRHSDTPNCVVEDVNGVLILKALRSISGNIGGEIGEELTTNLKGFV